MEFTAMERRKTDPNRSLTDEYLLELVENVEEEWRSMKRNKLSDQRSCTAVVFSSFDLLHGSPRSLMSSLQSTHSSPESGYKFKGRRLFEDDDDESGGRSEISYGGGHDGTVTRHKGLAAESGEFKGRRLFCGDDDDDDESEGRSEITDGTVTRDKSLNLSVSSGSCSCCSVCVPGPVVHEAESLWRRWRGFIGLVIAAAVFVFVGLGFEGFVDEQVMLVPT